MKKIRRLILIISLTIPAVNLFSQNEYPPFENNRFNSSIPEVGNARLPVEASYGLHDELLSDFIFRHSGLMQSNPVPEAISPGGRPGDHGTSGGIGQTPLGGGMECLLIVTGLYISLIGYKHIRKRHWAKVHKSA